MSFSCNESITQLQNLKSVFIFSFIKISDPPQKKKIKIQVKILVNKKKIISKTRYCDVILIPTPTRFMYAFRLDVRNEYQIQIKQKIIIENRKIIKLLTLISHCPQQNM